MIIKIKISEGKQGDDFLLIDNARNVGYNKLSKKILLDKWEPHTKGIIWYESYNNPTNDTIFTQLSYRNLDGGTEIILTDCPIYLMNDEGKTIERIN